MEVGPGETQSGNMTIKVPSDSKRGVKNLLWYVFAPCQQSDSKSWTVTVPKPECTLTPLSSVDGCPTDKVYLYWTITNSGPCKENFSFQSALGVGDASLTLLSDPPSSGMTGVLEPGGTYDGITGALINNQACGTRAINVTVTADEMTPVSEDGMVNVFEPNLRALRRFEWVDDLALG